MAVALDLHLSKTSLQTSASALRRIGLHVAAAVLGGLAILALYTSLALAAAPSAGGDVGANPFIPHTPDGMEIAFIDPPVTIENCRETGVWPACLYGLNERHLGRAAIAPNTGPSPAAIATNADNRPITMALLILAALSALALALVFFRHLKTTVHPRAGRRTL